MTVIVLTVLIDVLVAGFGRRCLAAILGSVAGTVATCLSAWGLTIFLKLDGGDLPYVVPLLSQSAMRVDTRSLYIGMMFLANSGALTDIINLKYVASQLLNTLVGSFGLAAAAPLTALIATGMYLQKPKPAELRAG